MNTNLALGIQPLRIPDPAAPIQKALSLNAMLGQNEMQGLQIGQARQALARQSKLDAIKSQSRDLVTMKDRLMQEGFTNEAIELDRHLREQQKSQGDLTEQKLKIAAGMAGGFLALDPESRKTNYPTFASEWVANGLPGTPPPQWDESLTNNLMRWASYTLPAQNVQERLDYAALGAPSMPATTMSERVTEVPTISGPKGLKLPYSESNLALLEQLPSDEAAFQERLASTGQAVAPTVGVEAKKLTGPDDLRARAEAMRNKGTKAAFTRAKELDDEADRLEKRIIEEQKLEDARLTRDQKKEDAAFAKRSKDIDNANKLRDDFVRSSKVFIDTRDAFTRISDASQDPSAAGDLALIFNYMKMLDPGSTVREGEFATAQNSTGVEGRVRSYYNNVIRGERLNPEQREDFVNRAERLYAGQLRNHERLEKQFKDLAGRSGINTDDVVINYRPNLQMGKGKGPRKAAGTRTDPFQVKSEADRSSVPKGAFYTAPDGSLRQKR